MITLRLVRANTSSLQACCPAMLALVLKLRQAVKPPRIDGNNPPARRSGRERLAVTMLKKHTSFSVQQQLGVDGPNLLFQLEELEVLPSKPLSMTPRSGSQDALTNFAHLAPRVPISWSRSSWEMQCKTWQCTSKENRKDLRTHHF